MISRFFDEGFLYVGDLREAHTLRDQILEAVVETKTVRTMEAVIRKRIKGEVRREMRGGKTTTERVFPELPKTL